MDFALSEEQKALVALAEDFCRREIPPDYVKELEKKSIKDCLPYDLLEKLHPLGITTLAVPVKYGGGGADFLTQVVVGEALHRYSGFLGIILASHWRWISDFEGCAQEELQDEIFPKIMGNARLVTAWAQTEADAGSDTQLPYDEPGGGMKTSAHRDGDEWVINGEKHFIGAGAQADLMLVCARTDKEAPVSKGISLFLVPTDTPGFSATVNNLISDFIRRIADPVFENVRIPARYLVGEENKAMDYIQSSLARMIINVGPKIGAMQRIYEQTKDYAKTRVQGGKPIFEHLNIGPRIVEMSILIETLRLLSYKCAWEYDQFYKQYAQQDRSMLAKIDPLTSLQVHALSKEAELKFVEHACEVWGGVGITKEVPLERYIRSVYVRLHGFGTRSLTLVSCMPRI